MCYENSVIINNSKPRDQICLATYSFVSAVEIFHLKKSLNVARFEQHYHKMSHKIYKLFNYLNSNTHILMYSWPHQWHLMSLPDDIQKVPELEYYQPQKEYERCVAYVSRQFGHVGWSYFD